MLMWGWQEVGLAPRGFMFWSILSEGVTPIQAGSTKPLYLSARLNQFLRTRPLALIWRVARILRGESSIQPEA